MAKALRFYQDYVHALADCEGTASFCGLMNDTFDALNRKEKADGITLSSGYFEVNHFFHVFMTEVLEIVYYTLSQDVIGCNFHLKILT